MRFKGIIMLASIAILVATGIGNALATTYTYTGGDGILKTTYNGPNSVSLDKTVSGYTTPRYGDVLQWLNTYKNAQGSAVMAFTSVRTISDGALSYNPVSYTVDPYLSQENKYSPGTVNTHSGEYLILAHHFYANYYGSGVSDDDDGVQFNVLW